MATSLSRVAWGPTLACVLSASVLVAAASSSLVQVQQARVAVAEVTGAGAPAGAAPAVHLALSSGSVATSWSADGRPGFLDVERPRASRWTLAVVPDGAAAGTLAVDVCPQPWDADGTCAGLSRVAVPASPVAQLVAGTALELGAATVAHLRVTLTGAASLVLSPA